MSKKSVKGMLGVVTAVVVLGGCESRPDQIRVARAAGHELTVDEMVGLLAGATEIPNDPRVVQTIAELWVDYTLLAEAMAEDSTAAHLDLGPLVEQQVQAQSIITLRDSLVTPDTAVSEEELRSLFASEGAGIQVRARHILLAFPPSPTEEQLDSLRQRAEEVRRRILDGEDFGAVAREVSDDPGSAQRGGDLGWFPRGQMVRSFDEAAFALEPGELSGVVESPYGYHVIRVEEKQVPSFDEVREGFRLQVQQRRMAAADSTFVAAMMDTVDVEVAENGVELTRQMARDPRTRLSSRAARRAVAEYGAGEVTVGEVRDLMMTQQPQFRARVADATDEVIRDAVLQDLVRRELLLERASTAGFEPSGEVVDSLTEFARQRFVEAARGLGLAPIQPQPGESREQAIDRVVRTMIEEMLEGVREPVPLGAVGFVLRRQYPFEIYDQVAIDLVVERVADARGPGAEAGPNRGQAPGQAPGREPAQGPGPASGSTQGGSPDTSNPGEPSPPTGGGGRPGG